MRGHLDDSQARLPPVGAYYQRGEGNRKGLCGYCVSLLIDKLLIYKDIKRDYISFTCCTSAYFFELCHVFINQVTKHYTILYNVIESSVREEPSENPASPIKHTESIRKPHKRFYCLECRIAPKETKSAQKAV